MIKQVKEYVSAEELSFIDDLGWVATGSDVNQVVTTLERCAAKSIDWANRQGLQMNTAKTEAVLFTCRQGHKNDLWPKLTAKIKVGNKFIPFNKQASRCLGIWTDAHLTFKEHRNRCMTKARAAEARLCTLTKTYGIVPESIRAFQVACVNAVELCGSEPWWHPKDVGRRDDLELLLNQHAWPVLGMLLTTPRGALMRGCGLTPAPGILVSGQRQFAARLDTHAAAN